MRTRTKQVLVFTAIVGAVVTFLALLVFAPMILAVLSFLAIALFLLWNFWEMAKLIVEHFGGGGGDA